MATTLICRVRLSRDTMDLLASKELSLTDINNNTVAVKFSAVTGIGDIKSYSYTMGVLLYPFDNDKEPILTIKRVKSHATSYDIEIYNVWNKDHAIFFARQILIDCSPIDNLDEINWKWLDSGNDIKPAAIKNKKYHQIKNELDEDDDNDNSNKQKSLLRKFR